MLTKKLLHLRKLDRACLLLFIVALVKKHFNAKVSREESVMFDLYYFGKLLQFTSIKKNKNSYLITVPLQQLKDVSLEIRTNSSDLKVFYQVFVLKEYMNVVRNIQSKGLTQTAIVDAGANVGYTSVFFKAFFPDIKIICIEPGLANSVQIDRHIKLNDLKNVINLNAALYSRQAQLVLSHDFRDGQDWSLCVREKETGTEEDVIKALTMNSLIDTYSLEKIDLLKMDIEGSEVEIFVNDKGISQWLENIDMLAIEIHEEVAGANRIKEILEESRFVCTEHGELTIATR